MKSVKYKLTTGHTISADEQDIAGMAGERMTILMFQFESGEVASYEAISEYLTLEDRAEVIDWLSDLYEANEANAISFIR